MNAPLRIVFAGTPEFAATALHAILEAGYKVIAVYTQPDRPAGRGQKLMPSPVKLRAYESQIPIYQPATLKTAEAQSELAALNPDILVVAAYGLLLPKAILDIPKFGCVNIHASLLPRWRGAAPIQRAIIAGDSETGITIMQMDVGLDTGDMLLKLNCAISSRDNAQTLHDKLAQLGGEAIVHALQLLERKQLTAEKQNENHATYAKKIQKDEAEINWAMPAIEIERRVRAYNPWPVAQTKLNGQQLRIWDADTISDKLHTTPGKVITANKNGIDVATGDGILRLTKLQLPGGKILDTTQFVNSNKIEGVQLGL